MRKARSYPLLTILALVFFFGCQVSFFVSVNGESSTLFVRVTDARPALPDGIEGFNLGITATFYAITCIILVIILGFIVLSTRFEYYKIERNEIYHKSGIFSSAERFPTKGLRIKKSIPDVFEFFMLRAGSMTLFPGRADEVIILPTVLNINKKEQQIDALLSYVSVEPDEVD